MPLAKHVKDLRVAILLPAYKRPEYTQKCIESLERCVKPCEVIFYLVDDGSGDNTPHILQNAKLNSSVKINGENEGLRDTTISFFEAVNRVGFDIIGKIDNDCVVPDNWLSGIIDVFEKTDADILSPNVMPSNAAMTYGKDDKDGKGYRPAEIVGGLWFMKADLVKDIYFERHPTTGLYGTISLLKQICVEKEPVIGWVSDIVVEDIGHWSGKHKDHIKTKAHEEYSLEVGRQIAWLADDI